MSDPATNNFYFNITAVIRVNGLKIFMFNGDTVKIYEDRRYLFLSVWSHQGYMRILNKRENAL